MFSPEFHLILQNLAEKFLCVGFSQKDAQDVFLNFCEDIECDEYEPGEVLEILKFIAENAPNWKPNSKMIKIIIQSHDVDIGSWFIHKISKFIRRCAKKIPSRLIFKHAKPDLNLYRDIISGFNYDVQDIRKAMPEILRVNYRNPKSVHLMRWIMDLSGMDSNDILSMNYKGFNYSELRSYLFDVANYFDLR